MASQSLQLMLLATAGGISVALDKGITGSINIWAVITGVIMVVILLLVFFATGIIKLPEKVAYPLSWWLVLAAAIAMYYFGFELSGVILGHVFLLILIDL